MVKYSKFEPQNRKVFMEIIDEILEFLHYHPKSKRADIVAYLENRTSESTIKRILARSIVDGLLVSSGRLTSNALLLAHGCCPLTFRSVDANDYRAALLLFYEQNNVSAFKRIFLDQVEFACNEYF